MGSRVGIAICLILGFSGCSSLDFYSQAFGGQWRILRDRVPIEDVLQALDQTEETKSKLRLVQEIRIFADQSIGMSVGEKYTSYVELQRPYVVWNVFAAERGSVQGEHWCYPIVGCAPYRGYFDGDDARRFAASLEADGFETYVAGVPAYSTLGWFDDPVLSTFLDWPEADLAGLLFHELAHGVVWVDGDVAFNESFASAVSEIAVAEYFSSGGRKRDYQQWIERRAAWRILKARLLDLKANLQTVFQETSPAETKSSLYQAFRDQYERDKSLFNTERFDRLVLTELNNAYLVSLGAYEDWVPAFRCLYAAQGAWLEFFAAVNHIAELDEAQRVEALRACEVIPE